MLVLNVRPLIRLIVPCAILFIKHRTTLLVNVHHFAVDGRKGWTERVFYKLNKTLGNHRWSAWRCQHDFITLYRLPGQLSGFAIRLPARNSFISIVNHIATTHILHDQLCESGRQLQMAKWRESSFPKLSRHTTTRPISPYNTAVRLLKINIRWKVKTWLNYLRAPST